MSSDWHEFAAKYEEDWQQCEHTHQQRSPFLVQAVEQARYRPSAPEERSAPSA
jgi:hypothetical protein